MPERDHFELHLLSEACSNSKPVFGICRGLQLINSGFGGTLFQDLSLAPFETIKHTQEAKLSTETHSIKLYGILKEIIGEDKCLVNSYHHQAIDTLANGFEVVARANDGIIEAIFTQNSNLWILGVQWHPELIVKHNNNSKKIFELFIQKSVERYNNL